MSAAHVLGVDLGATNLRVALGDPAGELLGRADAPVPATGPELARKVRELGGALAADAGVPWTSIRAAVVGVPGFPDGDGWTGLIAGAAGLTGAPLRRLLAEALGVPVTVENDVNLAALAELRRGHGAEHLAFIGVGTGIGMGVIADGRLLRGAAGAAGELGLLPYGGAVAPAPDGMGPLEVFAAGAGLAQRWGAAFGAPPAEGARAVFAAAEAGDARAAALLRDQAEALAAAVRAVQVLFDPALVVFGGGIGSRPDVVERVRAVIAAHGTPAPTIELSALGEQAGLVGAVAAALDLTTDTTTRLPKEDRE
jgi:predicted NBD/HSP70 family sugar kinase